MWIHGRSEETGRLGIIREAGCGWDDEKLGRNEVVLAR
jgi:hypothetical protein